MTKSQLLEIKQLVLINPDLLDVLDPREKKIIQERIGPPLKSLEAVAKRFGITRERVRQIEDIAGKKIEA